MRDNLTAALGLLGICLAATVTAGCPNGAPTPVFKLEKGIIGSWNVKADDVLTFKKDGTFEGTFNNVAANGEYSVRGELLFLDFESVDLFIVYTIFGTLDGTLYSDGGRSVNPWPAVE